MRIPGSEYGATVGAVAQGHDIPEEYIRTTLIPEVVSSALARKRSDERIRPTAAKSGERCVIAHVIVIRLECATWEP
jgi:hypothetical protein